MFAIELLKNAERMKQDIDNDTWNYLENGKEISDLVIEYKGIKLNIPMEIAEMNDYAHYIIDVLKSRLEDEFIESEGE